MLKPSPGVALSFSLIHANPGIGGVISYFILHTSYFSHNYFSGNLGRIMQKFHVF
jgi:hypothetical protein